MYFLQDLANKSWWDSARAWEKMHDQDINQDFQAEPILYIDIFSYFSTSETSRSFFKKLYKFVEC